MEFSQYLWVLINLYLIDILYQIIRFHFNHRVSKRKSGKYLHIFHMYLLVWQESRELCLMMVTSMICTKIINLNLVIKKIVLMTLVKKMIIKKRLVNKK